MKSLFTGNRALSILTLSLAVTAQLAWAGGHEGDVEETVAASDKVEPESHLVEANDSNFESIIKKTKGLVVVEMGETWCPGCRELKKTLGQMAGQTTRINAKGESEKVGFVAVNATASPETWRKYAKYGAVPQMIFFIDGKQAEVKLLVKENEQFLEKYFTNTASSRDQEGMIQLIKSARVKE